jgi:hypothetical protein
MAEALRANRQSRPTARRSRSTLAGKKLELVWLDDAIEEHRQGLLLLPAAAAARLTAPITERPDSAGPAAPSIHGQSLLQQSAYGNEWILRLTTLIAIA